MKQQSAGRYVAPLGHIIKIPSKPFLLFKATRLAVKQQIEVFDTNKII
jgi:hypothetical protein